LFHSSPGIKNWSVLFNLNSEIYYKFIFHLLFRALAPLLESSKLDRDLRVLIRENFTEFCSQEGKINVLFQWSNGIHDSFKLGRSLFWSLVGSNLRIYYRFPWLIMYYLGLSKFEVRIVWLWDFTQYKFTN
jgi:hypothetical protein